jgi:hypothetical protein
MTFSQVQAELDDRVSGHAPARAAYSDVMDFDGLFEFG